MSVAKMSVTIKNMLDDLGEDDDQPIPLPNVRHLFIYFKEMVASYIYLHSAASMFATALASTACTQTQCTRTHTYAHKHV